MDLPPSTGRFADAERSQMTDVCARPARVGDLPLILRGEKRYMLDVEPEHFAAWVDRLDENLQLWIDNLQHAIVYVVDGEDAGYAIWRHDGSGVTLITIHVLYRFRGRGAGRQLLTAVIEQARRQGAQRLHLDVEVHNEARALYERTGFRLLETDGDYAAYELELGR